MSARDPPRYTPTPEEIADQCRRYRVIREARARPMPTPIRSPLDNRDEYWDQQWAARTERDNA